LRMRRIAEQHGPEAVAFSQSGTSPAGSTNVAVGGQSKISS
jgi:hypothetical protein